MNITYAKIKENSRSRFFKPQPARASPLDQKIVDVQRIFLKRSKRVWLLKLDRSVCEL